MPSCYTALVQDGKITEAKDFILNCSRQFGALMHMREDNMDAEIEYRKVSDYHLERLESVKQQYEDLKKVTDEEIQENIDMNYYKRLEEKREGLKRFNEGRQRYLDMLEKVEKWTPPTNEHVKLKEYCIEQLKSSLDFDYSDSLKEYYTTKPEKETVEEYKQFQLESYLKDIEYHSKHYREEVENVKEINKWIEDLISSFK